MRVMFYLWEAQPTKELPSNLEETLSEFYDKVGTIAKSRQAFFNFGKAVMHTIRRSRPELASAFVDDPSDWGSNLSLSCLAIWELSVSSEAVEVLKPLMAKVAKAANLVLLDSRDLPASLVPPVAHPIVYPSDDKDILFRGGAIFLSDISNSDEISQIAQKFIPVKICADALVSTLIPYGFTRQDDHSFERASQHGKVIIQFRPIDVYGTPTKMISVDVGIVFSEAKKILSNISDVGTEEALCLPSMGTQLQTLAFSLNTPKDFFDEVPNANWTIHASTTEEVLSNTRQYIRPLLKIFKEQSLWFENPKEFTAVYLEHFLKKNQLPAGFNFLGTEDLILTQLYMPERLTDVYKKRRAIELAFIQNAKGSPSSQIHGDLRKVKLYVLQYLPANSGSSIRPNEAKEPLGSSSNSSTASVRTNNPKSKSQISIRSKKKPKLHWLVIAVLVQILVTFVIRGEWRLIASLANIVLTAYAIIHAGEALEYTAWAVAFLIALSLAPIVSLVILLFLIIRVHRFKE